MLEAVHCPNTILAISRSSMRRLAPLLNTQSRVIDVPGAQRNTVRRGRVSIEMIESCEKAVQNISSMEVPDIARPAVIKISLMDRGGEEASFSQTVVSPNGTRQVIVKRVKNSRKAESAAHLSPLGRNLCARARSLLRYRN